MAAVDVRGVRRPIAIVAIVMSALGLACLTGGCSEASDGHTPAPATIRVAYTSIADIEDLSSLAAQRRLSARGYRIEPTFYAQPELAVQAVATGGADLAHGSTRAFWAGAQAGAGIVTLMAHARNSWRLVAREDVAGCDVFRGHRIAAHSIGSTDMALLGIYRKRFCSAEPVDVIVMPGSPTRAAALAAGEVDATLLRLEDVLQLERRAPRHFHVLIDFGRELRDFVTSAVHARSEFVRSSPDTVTSYLEAILSVNREVPSNAEPLFEAARQWLSRDDELLDEVVRRSIDAGTWPVNGGLSMEIVRSTLDVMIETGALQPGLLPEKVADLSHLERALERLGRVPDRTTSP